MSGGEEHSSLDSLRQNFCISDLKSIENQLKRWLNRQGPEGVEIAEQLNFRELSSVEDYFAVYKLFFQKELKDNKIDNSSQLIKYWHRQKRNSKDIDTLIRLGFGKDDNITVFCYRHKDEFSDLTDDWLATLKSIHTKTEEIVEWIAEEAIRQEKQKRQELIMQYNIRGVNVKRFKQHIQQNFPDTGRGWTDFPYTVDEEKIKNFVVACKNIKAIPMTYVQARERLFKGLPFLPKQFFGNENRFAECRAEDFMFDAKLFILLLILKYQTPESLNDEWVKEFFKVISQKQYEIIQNYAVTTESWYELGNLIQRFILNDLFKFLNLE